MTADEWRNLHPEAAEAMMKAWQEKQSREDTRIALIRHTVAQAGGMKRKGGGALSLDDFLPSYCRKKTKDPAAIEARLKTQLMAMAKRKKSNG